MATQIQIRRDTSANWTSVNPTLANGEQGYETDTKKMKIGDGVTAWTGLAYFSAGSGSSASNATTTSPGLVQLAGDLAGTATSPTVAKLNGLAITGTPDSGKYLDGSGVWTILPASSGGGAVAGANVTDRILFVSKSGSDTNDGLSWKTAFLTVSKAISVMSYYYGVIYVGYGVFTESGLSLQGTQKIRGVGRHGTYLQLASNGTLLNLDNQSNPSLESLSLSFATASVTGTLLSMANAFTCTFIDVGFDGVQSGNTGSAGQIGVSLTNNAGDSHFIGCEFQLLDIGVNNQTTVNYFTDCNFTSCKSASIRGGVPAGSVWAAGASITNCTFRGWGDYYIDVNGTAQAWTVDQCFFDGQATTAIRVGQGTKGPWMFTLTNCPYLSGANVCLELNAANVINLDSVVWGDSYTNGQHPTELVVSAGGANIPRGKLGPYLDLQGNNLGALLPSSGWTKF